MKKVLLMAAAVATLFASCSKDATEDVVTISGDAAFVASMTFDQNATTRHHINEVGNYEWEAGDMVGVTTAATNAEYVPFITKAGGEKAVFEAVGNDLDYLGEGPYYMAYPYGETLSVVVDQTTGNTTISGLTVPAIQRYRAGSFSTMTAPAYAIVDEFALEGQEVEFDAAASMLKFYVQGVGSIESLTLSVDDVELSGDFDVVIKAEDAKKDAETEAIVESSDVVLSFGKTPLQLDPYTAKPVVFVVKSGISLAGKTINLTASFGEGETETIGINIPETANNMNNILANALKTFSNPKSFGYKGKYVIDEVAAYGLTGAERAVLDFISYAYLAQEDTMELTDDWDVIKDKLGDEAYTLQAYILAKTIDLAAFDAKAVYNKLGVYATRETENNKPIVDVYQHVLTWYIKNENAIESLCWGENGIAVVGANDEPTVINGLTVLGNGISASAGLENLKFTNSTVVTTANTVAGFVAPKGDTAVVKDVVLGENNQLIATGAGSNYVGGVVGNYSVSVATIDVTVEAVPTIVTTLSLDETRIGQLYGVVNADKSVKISLPENNITSLDVPAVYETTGSNVVDFTSNVVAPKGAKFAGVVAKNLSSSVVVDGVSYYNGTPASNVGGADYFTAEELAYGLNYAGVDSFVLTHSIDMQGIAIGTGHSDSGHSTVNSSVVDGVQNQFEIKNVVATWNSIGNVQASSSLFGNADVSNVKLTNITINVNAVATKAAGVAISGTITNVDINGLTINIPEKATELQVVGGVLAEAEADDIDTVNVKGLAITNAGADVLKIRAGIMAGTLNINPAESANLKPFYAGAATFTNVGEEQPTCSKGQLEYYTSECNYGANLPYGTISVDNAGFAINGNIKAYLNVAEGKFGSMTRLAAGIVFDNQLTNVTEKVEYVEADVDKYNYVLISNAPIAKQKKIFGFMKK